MRIFNVKNIKQEFTCFIRDWIKLLSEDKFSEACLLLDTPENKEENIWNSRILENVFKEYFRYERKPIVNDPYKMNLENERISFYKYKDETGYGVDYDIPINNEWRDLTATFSFINKIGHLYLIYLVSIRVL